MCLGLIKVYTRSKDDATVALYNRVSNAMSSGLIKLSNINLARTLLKEEASVALSRSVSTIMSPNLRKLCTLSVDDATVALLILSPMRCQVV